MSDWTLDLICIIIVYYLFVIVKLLGSDGTIYSTGFESKKEFLIALIPFGDLIQMLIINFINL